MSARSSTVEVYQFGVDEDDSHDENEEKKKAASELDSPPGSPKITYFRKRRIDTTRGEGSGLRWVSAHKRVLQLRNLSLHIPKEKKKAASELDSPHDSPKRKREIDATTGEGSEQRYESETALECTVYTSPKKFKPTHSYRTPSFAIMSAPAPNVDVYQFSVDEDDSHEGNEEKKKAASELDSPHDSPKITYFRKTEVDTTRGEGSGLRWVSAHKRILQRKNLSLHIPEGEEKAAPELDSSPDIPKITCSRIDATRRTGRSLRWATAHGRIH